MKLSYSNYLKSLKNSRHNVTTKPQCCVVYIQAVWVGFLAQSQILTSSVTLDKLFYLAVIQLHGINGNNIRTDGRIQFKSIKYHEKYLADIKQHQLFLFLHPPVDSERPDVSIPVTLSDVLSLSTSDFQVLTVWRNTICPYFPLPLPLPHLFLLASRKPG